MKGKLILETSKALILSPILTMVGAVGNKLRYAYYKNKLKHLGNNVILDVGVQLLNPEFISIGDNTWIDKYVILIAGAPRPGRITYYKENIKFPGKEGELYIGSSCHIAPHCVISGHGGVWLGRNLTVASGSRVYSFSHHYRNLLDRDDPRTDYYFSSRVPDFDQSMISGPVVMEDNTALGLNSVILPGVTIGKGSWIASMSLVMNDIEPNVVAGGIPATVIKHK